MTKISNVTRDQDDVNIRLIHGYYQGRVLFRHFYPSDGANSFGKNRRLYEVALNASLESRQALAKQLQRRVLKGLAIVGAALLLLCLVL